MLLKVVLHGSERIWGRGSADSRLGREPGPVVLGAGARKDNKQTKKKIKKQEGEQTNKWNNNMGLREAETLYYVITDSATIILTTYPNVEIQSKRSFDGTRS